MPTFVMGEAIQGLGDDLRGEPGYGEEDAARIVVCVHVDHLAPTRAVAQERQACGLDEEGSPSMAEVALATRQEIVPVWDKPVGHFCS